MDLTIIGTGISSVLLAEALIERRCFGTLRLIGPAPARRGLRASYWSEEPTPFDRFADTAWSEVQLVDAAGSVFRLTLERFAYRSFEMQRFLDDAWARVLSAPGVVHVQATVERAFERGEKAVAESASASFESDWIFSSGRLDGAMPARWQHFAGWEVELADGVAPPKVPTLLDFRTPSERDFRFCYALPLGPRRLFVEHVAYEACEHARYLEAYLHDALKLGAWKVVAREAGTTPLYRARPHRGTSRIVPIGVAGGLAKNATGYALVRMWRDAQRIATHLAREGNPGRLPHRSLMYRIADEFFLDTLSRRPHQLPALFSALFAGASGDAVLAFLDDRARPMERLAVARSMPAWFRWFAMKRGAA